jgi:hypothetical protein
VDKWISKETKGPEKTGSSKEYGKMHKEVDWKKTSEAEVIYRPVGIYEKCFHSFSYHGCI